MGNTKATLVAAWYYYWRDWYSLYAWTITDSVFPHPG